jgi:hypothetical protein
MRNDIRKKFYGMNQGPDETNVDVENPVTQSL